MRLPRGTPLPSSLLPLALPATQRCAVDEHTRGPFLQPFNSLLREIDALGLRLVLPTTSENLFVYRGGGALRMLLSLVRLTYITLLHDLCSCIPTTATMRKNATWHLPLGKSTRHSDSSCQHFWILHFTCDQSAVGHRHRHGSQDRLG